MTVGNLGDVAMHAARCLLRCVVTRRYVTCCRTPPNRGDDWDNGGTCEAGAGIQGVKQLRSQLS